MKYLLLLFAFLVSCAGKVPIVEVIPPKKPQEELPPLPFFQPQLLRSFATLEIPALSAPVLQTAVVNPESPEEVSLAWDPNPEPTVAGYKLYQGSEVGVYDRNYDVPEGTSATAEVLNGDVFAVAAYDDTGIESPLSQPLQLLKFELQESEDLQAWQNKRELWIGTRPLSETSSRFWRLKYNLP